MDDRYAEEIIELLHSVDSKLLYFKKLFNKDLKKKIKLKDKKNK